MPVYHSACLNAPIPFLDMLTTYLKSLAQPASISLVTLGKDEGSFGLATRYDYLLVREGIPLVAVAISTTASAQRSVGDYVDVRAYSGDETALDANLADVRSFRRDQTAGAGNLADLASRMVKRVVDEMTPTKTREVIEEEPPIDELTWKIVLRHPGIEQVEFKGGPFDVDGIEKAFTAITDALVARNKATTPAAP